MARRVLASEPLQAALVLAGFLVVFLWTPITEGGYYAPADFFQSSTLFRTVSPDYRIKNGLMGDPVVVFVPFLKWNTMQLWDGQLPVWNPYNGAGVPHLASFHAAVLSPFSLPYYILDFRVALVAAAFLRLFGLGYFTYLFLRRVGLVHVAALVAAVTFTFSGYNVVWLNWGIPGSAFALPAGLYFAERAFQADDEHAARRGLALVGFALALACSLVAGHPETLFYCVLLLGGYLLFRVLRIASSWRMRARRSAEFALAGAAALGLAAGQLLPFFEYLEHSTIVAARNAVHQVLPVSARFAPLQVFPNLLGNPSLPYHDPVVSAAGLNYNIYTSNAIALTALFLAGLAVLTLPRHRSPLVAFFATVVLIWLPYGYDIGGFGAWVNALPVFKLMVLFYSGTIWLFSISCLAGLGVHMLVAGDMEVNRSSRRRIDSASLRVGGVVLWGLVVLDSALVGAYVLLNWAADQPNNQVASDAARTTMLPQVIFIMAVTVVAIASVAVFVATPFRHRSSRLRSSLGGMLMILIFLQYGLVFKDYNPTVEDRYFFPVTPVLAEVTRQIGDAQTLWLDRASLRANGNLWYGLRSQAHYDGIGVAVYDHLHARLMRAPTNLDDANPTSLRALQVMGVQYIVSAQADPLERPIRSAARPGPSSTLVAQAILPDQPLSQTFVVSEPGLAAIALPFAAYGRTNSCTLVQMLEDVATGSVITQATTMCRDVRDNVPHTFRFPRQAQSANREYRVTLSSPDATPNNALAAYSTVPGGDAQATSRLLLMELHGSRVDGLELIWSGDSINLFRVPNSLPSYFTVAHGIPVQSDEEALVLLERPGVDLTKAVLLHDGHGIETTGDDEAAQEVHVVEETPTRTRLQVQREVPGWLVVLRTFYPGWTASVNGVATAVVRANVAFSAVRVDAGASEVVLEYRPLSVDVGMSATVATVLGLVATTIILTRRRLRS